MESSPTPEPPVDTEASGESIGDDAHADAQSGGSSPGVAARARKALREPEASQLRYSPVVLVIDVVRLLRGRGLAIVESLAYSGEALRTSADLLRCMGVEPDHFAHRRVETDGPAVGAAATLMRAAGIEPNDVVVWPGRQS